MATLFRANGQREEILALQRNGFTLQELDTLVGGEANIEEATDGNIIVLNMNINRLQKTAAPINHEVSARFWQYKHPLYGDVLIGTPEELGEYGKDNSAYD